MNYNGNNSYDNNSLIRGEEGILEGFMSRVYAWMALALVLSGFTAYTAASSATFFQILRTTPGLHIGLAVASLACVFVISFLIEKLPLPLLIVTFLGYSFLVGLMLSTIFLVYTLGSITMIFFVTAGSFFALSVYGTVTKRDLSAMGAFMFIGLIGLILASIGNFFLRSPSLYWALSVVGVIVFAGLTAYDTQKLREMGRNLEGAPSGTQLRMAISGALSLYLDFINMFLYLLRLFGSKR